MVTINEMIYNTITTKVEKVPKYKKELEALGYTLNNTHDWSAYKYWGIDTEKGILVISKDYGGHKRLYFTAFPVNGAKKEKIKLVDFVNLINKPQKDKRVPKTAVTRYKNLKSELESREWLVNQYRKDIEEMKRKIEEKQKTMALYEERAKETQQKIQEIFEEKRKGLKK